MVWYFGKIGNEQKSCQLISLDDGRQYDVYSYRNMSFFLLGIIFVCGKLKFDKPIGNGERKYPMPG